VKSCCAQTAEPINLPLGLLTRVGRRKHKFNHIWQVVPLCPPIGATWWIRFYRLFAAAMRSYV